MVLAGETRRSRGVGVEMGVVLLERGRRAPCRAARLAVASAAAATLIFIVPAASSSAAPSRPEHKLPSGPLTLSMAAPFAEPSGPSISGLEPTSGPSSGGTPVAITGLSFTGATAVKFGANEASSFMVNSEESITAVSPPGAGTVDVSVTTPSGTTPLTPADQFGYTVAQQTAKLTAIEEDGGGDFGWRTSLSSDGNTLLVTGDTDHSGAGAAWVFAREGSSWRHQGPKLIGGSEVGAGEFGQSAALSGEGSTALIGAPLDQGGLPGAAWFFTRSGSTWAQQGSKLAPSEPHVADFGRAAAISANGSTTLIGVEVESKRGVWVYERSGSTWARSAELAGAPESRFTSAALSADGQVAVVGAEGEAAWVFTRSGSSWTEQGRLTPPGAPAACFGDTAAVSANGKTALIGDACSAGAAWVFARSGSTWAEQAELGGGGEVGEAEFSRGVALSSSGNIALIGGPADNEGRGAAWLFSRSGSTWTQQGAKLTAAEAIGKANFGASVALSGDATTLAVGGPFDNRPGSEGGLGADWVFANDLPFVTGVQPSSGAPSGGTSVTITGVNLGGATAVRFGSSNATSFTVNSEQSITAVAPPGSGTVDVTVSTAEGTSFTSSADQFAYSPVPIVSSVEPSGGSSSGGTSVTITGLNFTGATAVRFGSTNARSFTVNSERSITAVSPGGGGIVDVTVSTPEGTSATSAADQFQYSGPFITNVEPHGGPISGGTSVTITGVNFTNVTAVEFGSTNSKSFTVNSPTSITAVSPAGTGTVDISVTTFEGTSLNSSADRFMYGTLPEISSVEPSGGPLSGGTSVTINGINFTGATGVKFGSSNATSFTVEGDRSIRAVSPPGTGRVDITVTIPQGTSPTSPADQFFYNTGPTVTKLEPSSGPANGGTSVTITGTNLSDATGVRFGSSIATQKVESESRITAVSPVGAGGTVDVRVIWAGGASPVSSADQFTYTGGPLWYANLKLLGTSPLERVLTWGQLALDTPAGTISCKDVSYLTSISNEQTGHGVGQSDDLTAGGCTDPELERSECPVVEPGENRCAVFVTAEMPLLHYQEQEGAVCKDPSASPPGCAGSELEERMVFTKGIRRTASTPWMSELEYGTRAEEEATLQRIGAGAEGKSCYPTEKAIVEGHEVERPASWEDVPAGCMKLDVIAPRLGIEMVYYGTLEPQLVSGSKNGLFPSTLAFNGEAGKLVSSEGAEGEATLTGELTIEEGRNVELITAR